MSLAATIRRNGTPIIWRKMGGTGGSYDYSSATVVAPPIVETTIYGVIDGFGSQSSRMVNAEELSGNDLIIAGTYHVFTNAKVEAGDILTFGGDSYTIYDVKQVWKKSEPVLFMAAVKR